MSVAVKGEILEEMEGCVNRPQNTTSNSSMGYDKGSDPHGSSFVELLSSHSRNTLSFHFKFRGLVHKLSTPVKRGFGADKDGCHQREDMPFEAAIK
ncbi:hypothetical protein EVAR_25396_1 [Eumeta japonica]|uniref:Uncharacterized protein n=1 Tax=Eumeta variegata TaxID=151549 RepID=A0A4C1V7S7_EUMVA|nr:hypothetical protein EVAR_25396_1 [Eumeta japonica]